jgi:hypothetical protein
LRPAANKVDLFKTKRSHFRKVSVPFCEECLALRKSKSRTQILFERIAGIACLLVGWIVGIWIYGRVLSWGVVAAEHSWRWGALIGGIATISVFGSLYFAAKLFSLRFRAADTKAVLAAVRIHDFDWETTTLEFADDAYADRFARVNQTADSKERRAQER